MLKLIIGNRRYSSWSLRGWLALRHADIAFETVVLPMDTPEWAEHRRSPDLAPSGGKVPILWRDKEPVWDSLALLAFAAEETGPAHFWPHDPAARRLALSMVAEMHSGFAALRKACPMNLGVQGQAVLSGEVQADVGRILQLWQRALEMSDGPYLFGAWGAADIGFAPVVTRFLTYGVTLPDWAQAYADTVRQHPNMIEWYDAAAAEPWRIAATEALAPAPAAPARSGAQI